LPVLFSLSHFHLFSVLSSVSSSIDSSHALISAGAHASTQDISPLRYHDTGTVVVFPVFISILTTLSLPQSCTSFLAHYDSLSTPQGSHLHPMSKYTDGAGTVLRVKHPPVFVLALCPFYWSFLFIILDCMPVLFH
jgi:hypothetical protein